MSEPAGVGDVPTGCMLDAMLLVKVVYIDMTHTCHYSYIDELGPVSTRYDE